MKMTRALLAAAALCLAATLVTLGPAGSALAAEIEIPYTEFTLDNGLRVIVHEDHKAPIVAVNIWYHVGSKNEKLGKTGFAHLFEHLMFNGSENFNDEYFKPFDRVGATNQNGTTWLDRTNYFQDVPSTAVDLALWMESDRMGHLLGAVTQERLDEQRGVVQNEKRQGENQPYGKVWEVLQDNLFPAEHPYSWETIGSMEDLNAASLEDVKEWFETYYGPNNAVLVLAGDITPEEAREKAERYFGDIPPGPPITKFDAWAPRLEDDKRVLMQDRVPQARLFKAWVGPPWGTADADLLTIAGAVLSSGKTSRLFQRLVYDDQIATAVDAAPLFFEIAGILGVDTTAHPGGDLGVIERAVDEELARFLKEGPTEEEVERAVTQIRAQMIRGLEQVGGFNGKAQLLAENATYAGDPSYYQASLERMENATPAAVLDAARRWHSAPSFTLEVHPYPELAASADGVDRSGGPPIPDEFPDVDFDDFERAFLSNGMELLVVRRDAVPVVQFSLLFDAGYSADAFAELGTSNLVMTMLDEGTKRRSALEISEELASLGSVLSMGANVDQSNVYLNTIRDSLDPSLDIFADVVLNPQFPENELTRLKKQVAAGIQAEQNSPVQLALRVVPNLIYGEGHAYDMPLTGSGTVESLETIERGDLVEFHETWFRPNNATMVVVGDTSLAEIQPKLEKLFAGWDAADVPQKNIGAAKTIDEEHVYIIDRPGAEQSVVISAEVVPPAKDADEFALQAMNDVLGGAFSARVNMNLREDKAWAYGAYTFVLGGAGPRPFIGYAPVQTDKTALSMQELRNELVAIQSSQPPEADELARAMDENTLSLPGTWETAGAVAGSLAEMVRYGYDDDYWDKYAERVRGLSLAEVREAAQTYINPDNLVWVVVGDRDRIEDEVRALEFGPVTFLDENGQPVEAADTPRP
ncbi:MAG TPA: pitrilysin family protein [Woeseiaceae bacterium]|nr:pitrilysin family protein [Woeseiaceae bacterium]